MSAHAAVVTRMDGLRGMLTCRHDTGERDLVEIWNGSGSTVSGMVFGSPSEVFERIVSHLTVDDDTPATAEVVEASRALVGLANNVQPGVELLAENLPYLSVTVVT